MTKEAFQDLVNIARRSNPRWRHGQTVFNCMLDVAPVFAEELRGSKIDPFYTDANINAVLALAVHRGVLTE